MCQCFIFLYLLEHCDLSCPYIGGQHCWTLISLSGSLPLIVMYFVYVRVANKISIYLC